MLQRKKSSDRVLMAQTWQQQMIMSEFVTDLLWTGYHPNYTGLIRLIIRYRYRTWRGITPLFWFLQVLMNQEELPLIRNKGKFIVRIDPPMNYTLVHALLNSLCLAQKYTPIVVCGHYLFRKANSFSSNIIWCQMEAVLKIGEYHSDFPSFRPIACENIWWILTQVISILR